MVYLTLYQTGENGIMVYYVSFDDNLLDTEIRKSLNNNNHNIKLM